MTAVALLQDLQARGVELQPAGDNLRFRPADRVTPELRAALAAHKAELLALLAEHAPPVTQAEHAAFVQGALRTFPGSRLPEGAESYADAFRALARLTWPDLTAEDRFQRAMSGLVCAISRMEDRGDAVAVARARAVSWILVELERSWRTTP